MPLKSTQSAQLCTLAQAEATMQQLVSKGVPVADLRENSPQNGVVSVNDPNYLGDGGNYQYILNVWGKDQIVGLVAAAFASAPTPFAAFLEIATSSNPLSQVQALNSVIGLPIVIAAINAALKV